MTNQIDQVIGVFMANRMNATEKRPYGVCIQHTVACDKT
ncbi:hypothetical protein C2W64_01724 [Brevibacillus laterosporus]|nr:hypothetical protein C2W64_01724 [Brevibacillus laterosporus]